MNRKQRREFAKNSKIPFGDITNILNSFAETNIKSGDLVKLNIDNILVNKHERNEKYLNFVQENKDTYFVVEAINKANTLFNLVGDENNFIFACSELIKIDEDNVLESKGK